MLKGVRCRQMKKLSEDGAEGVRKNGNDSE